jgi:diguanylate cyclase (GGDEF)-like protein
MHDLSPAADRLHALEQAFNEALPKDAERALALAQEAYALAKRLGERDALVRHGLNLGEAHSLLGEVASALALYRELESIVELGSAPHADLLHATAIIYDTQGAYELALGHLVEALKHRRALGDHKGEARALNSIGIIFGRSGDHAQSLYYYEQALARFRELGDTINEALTLNNLGIAHKNLGEYQTACESYLAALERFSQLGHTLGQGATSGNLAVARGLMGHNDAAEALFDEALARIQQVGHRAFELELHLDYAELHLRCGKADAALAELQVALPLAERLDAKSTQARAQLALAETYKQLGDFAMAYEQLWRHHQLNQEVSAQAAERRLQALKVHFQLEQAERDREIYRLRNVELKQALDQLAQQARLLEQQATRDPLTGLYNRRYLDRMLAEELERSVRYHHPLSVAIADIDFFKRINDSFSHAIGDEVLKTLAEVFTSATRTVDVIARFGGEEFVVVFRSTPLAQAARAAEKMRVAVAGYPWHEIHPELKVTVSIGVAERGALATAQALLDAADKQLYRAKHQGKNRVMH